MNCASTVSSAIMGAPRCIRTTIRRTIMEHHCQRETPEPLNSICEDEYSLRRKSTNVGGLGSRAEASDCEEC